MKLHLSLLCVIFIFVQTVIGQEWKNIIPLKSTRADVEKMLGTPSENNGCGFIYPVSDGKVIVNYAIGKCKGALLGWNVESGTVLTFSFIPNNGRTTDIDKIDKEKLISFQTHTLTGFFIDPERGIKYRFTPHGELEEVKFTPTVNDNKLRCKGFPYYNLASASYIPFFAYNETDIKIGKAQIDIHLSALHDDVRAYVMAYSGRNFSGKKYNNYLRELERYIRTKGRVDPKKVVIIDAGKRDLFLVEVFALPIKYPPPMP